MRAVAISLVLIYHAGVRQLPGGFVGVDVFFVISGFLITGLLVREIQESGRVSLTRFYARRAKRLLPATGVVLAATALLTWLSITTVQWRDFGYDIVNAALYVVNWRLADRSVDYLAEDIGQSPVQHFWSLAVEEQFYIVWPLLLVLLAWLLRKRPNLRSRPILATGIIAVIIPSFIWSIHYTSTNPTQAFFVTPTRLWELGIGALVAIGATVWIRIPRIAAIVMGWVGLATVVASSLLITATTPWPGSAALGPTIGTAAMIIAGYASGRSGLAGLLSWRPAVWVGGLSYSLYLWHWPLLVTATAQWGDLGAKKGLLVIAASFIPAYLCNRWVENPIRFAKVFSRSHGYTLSMGANFTAIGATAGLVLVLIVPTVAGPGEGQVAGAASLQGNVAEALDTMPDPVQFTPDPNQATKDVPDAYAQGCQQTQTDSTPIHCEYGDPNGDITIVVTGDSKILQYESALKQIADDEGWRVVSITKSACGFHAGMQLRHGKPYTNCAEWNTRALEDILTLKPDLVITSQLKSTALTDPEDASTADREAMVDALATQWQQLDDANIPVAVFLDNPSSGHHVYECVAENPDDLSACYFDRDQGLKRSGAAVLSAAAKRVDNVDLIDFIDLLCPDPTCVPVIGNVLVYRQGSHITDTYVRTMEPEIKKRLVAVVKAQSG